MHKIFILFYLFIIFLIFWLHRATCRILVPQPGIESRPQQWKHQVLTTGPPGNSPVHKNFKSQCILFHICLIYSWEIALYPSKKLFIKLLLHSLNDFIGKSKLFELNNFLKIEGNFDFLLIRFGGKKDKFWFYHDFSFVKLWHY